MDDGAHGRELWKSDGTSGGTRLVKDINAGAMPSNPSSLPNVNGTLFFTAREDVHGRELWKSDGTEAGAVLVANLAPGSEGSNVGGLTAAGDNLYFMYGGLWRSNGTTAGTVRLLEIDSTPLSEDNGISERISSLTPTPGGVYFQRDYLSLYGMSSSEVWFAGEGSARAIFDAPGSFRDSLISDISVINDVIYSTSTSDSGNMKPAKRFASATTQQVFWPALTTCSTSRAVETFGGPMGRRAARSFFGRACPPGRR